MSSANHPVKPSRARPVISPALQRRSERLAHDGLREAMIPGIRFEGRPRIDAELARDVRAVLLDREFGDIEAFADFLVPGEVPDHRKNCLLAVREDLVE